MSATSVLSPSRPRLQLAALLLPLALALAACSQPRTDDASVAPDADAALSAQGAATKAGAGEVIVIARFEEDEVGKLHLGQRAVVHLTEMVLTNDRMGRTYTSERPAEGFEGRVKAFGEPSAASAMASSQEGSFVKVKQRKPVQIAVAVPAEARALFLPMRKAIVEMQRD